MHDYVSSSGWRNSSVRNVLALVAQRSDLDPQSPCEKKPGTTVATVVQGGKDRWVLRAH